MSDFSLSPDDLEDQRERLKDRFDVDDDRVDEVWEDVRLRVNLASQEAGYKWSDETKDAVTNVVLSLHQQLIARQQKAKQAARRRLIRDGVLHVALVVVAYAAISGLQTDGTTMPVLASGLAAVILFTISVGSRYINR